MRPDIPTPYDGSTRPFTIGLNALADGDWVYADADGVLVSAKKLEV